MGFFFGKKEKEKNIDISKDYMAEAEATALIVSEGLEKGDLSSMNDKLSELTKEPIEREKFVFARDNDGIYISRLYINGILLIPVVCLLLISFFTYIYSDSFENFAIAGLVLSIFMVVWNIISIKHIYTTLKFNKRYDEYEKILRYKSVGLVDDIVEYTKSSEITVINDLTRAIEDKLIPQGHFGRDNLIFMVSDKVNEMYLSKKAVYDRYYRKQSEERLRMKERTKEISKILDEGNRYLEKIHDCNDLIDDKSISQDIAQIETLTSTIFREVDINPQYSEKIGLLINYYLPTTEKLLDTYISLSEEKTTSRTKERSKKDIEKSLSMIIKSFEGILDKFYQEQEMDVASDISTMEIMMKQEGLLD